MRRISLFTVRALALVSFLFLLASCAKDPLGGSEAGEGYTITLHMAATVSPLYDTEALVRPTVPGGEAGEGRFDCEMVSSDADSVAFSLVTKAPTTLKNVYALLFTSAGAFNGRAAIGTITAGSALDITFTNVTTTTAANSRLVIVANDNAAATNYASSGGTGGFGSFSGTYADFQRLTITSNIAIDADVPYAGYATFNLLNGSNDTDISVPIYRTLAKITFKNTFNITGGPARNSITLYNAGERRFATPNNDTYDGLGSTQTTAFVATTVGGNDETNVWYVGENIRPAGSGIVSGSDRNGSKAPANACYVRIESAASSVNNTPSVGEEYIAGASGSFTYDIYLGNSSVVSDFSLRRHTNYTLTTSVDGTLAKQQELSLSDGRVKLTTTGGTAAGLCIGCFGGASGYTAGAVGFTAVSGSYTKHLLLQPNTSGTTAVDDVTKVWSNNTTTLLQPESRKSWDPTYTSTHIDKSSGLSYDYCYNLTLGGVAKGTWYLPTQMQMAVIYAVYKGMRESNAFAKYSSFKDSSYYDDYYGCSTECGSPYVWIVGFGNGEVGNYMPSKKGAWLVRCVRDIGDTLPAQSVTTAEVGGYPVVDLSGLYPLGCVLTSSEAADRLALMNTQTPDNYKVLGVGLDVSGTNGTWNTKLSGKFQVMRADHTDGTAKWATAYTRCREYSGEGGVAGQWRLPTHRELILITALHPQLRGISGFSPFSASEYWSSTEGFEYHAWYVDFAGGYVYKCNHRGETSKPDSYSVRCVRDL